MTQDHINQPSDADVAHFMAHWVDLLRGAARERQLGPKRVAQLIGVSESSYHKRCRGNVQFSAPEFSALCDHFDLPSRPSELNEARLGFTTAGLASETFCANAYLDGLTKLGESMGAAVASGRPVDVTVSSSDIPIFQLFREPALVAFKLFVFDTAHTVELEQRLDLNSAVEERGRHIAAAQRVAEVYTELPTREVWGVNPLAGLLYQIAHLVRARALGPVDLAEIIAAVRRVIARIAEEAQACAKTSGASFRLHQNRLHATNTTVTAALGERTLTFLTVDNPNFIRSDQSRTHGFFVDTFEQIRRRSTPINGTGIYTARLFAEDLESSVRRLEKSMNYQLQAYNSF